MEENKNLSLENFLNQEEIKDMIKHNLDRHFNKIYLQKDRTKSLLEEIYKPLIKEQVKKCTDEIIKSKYISLTTNGRVATTILENKIDSEVDELISYYSRVYLQEHLKTAAKDYINNNIEEILKSKNFKIIIEELLSDKDFIKELMIKK